MRPGHLLVQMTMDGTPPVVYAALTDPSALTAWFADHVRSDPAAGRFSFWGRRTPGGDHGRQHLVEVHPGRRITFLWTIDGVRSPVEIALSEAPRGRTQVRVTQWGAPEPGPDEPGLLDFWCLAVGNLANFVEGRAGPVHHDFTPARAGHAEVEIEVAAPAGPIFAALTVPEQLDRWIAVEASVHCRPGGRYDLGWGGDQGPSVIVELVAPSVLAYTWREAGRPDTVVRWTLRRNPTGGTTVRVRHELPPGWPPGRLRIGWANFLIDLQRMVESGEDWHRSVWQQPAVPSSGPLWSPSEASVV